MKLYAERDPRDLEPHFSKHMSAMTSEDLHSKAAIAEELAYRDQRIDALVEGLRQIESLANIEDSRHMTNGFRHIQQLAEALLNGDNDES